MKLDLNYLNRFSKINIDEDISLDSEYYKNTEKLYWQSNKNDDIIHEVHELNHITAEDSRCR